VSGSTDESVRRVGGVMGRTIVLRNNHSRSSSRYKRRAPIPVRHLVIAAIALAFASGLSGVRAIHHPLPVLALQCTGNPVLPFPEGRNYVLAKKYLDNPATGIKGTVFWTNPDPCWLADGSAFSLEGVSLCHLSAGNCDAWVQPGWRKNEGFANPMMVCEFTDNTGESYIYYFSLTTSSHVFEMRYNPSQAVWTCYRDGTAKITRPVLGMSSGTFINAQGEVNSLFGQIGRIYTNKLVIDTVKVYQAGAWSVANLGSLEVDENYHYGGDQETLLNSLRNWSY